MYLNNTGIQTKYVYTHMHTQTHEEVNMYKKQVIQCNSLVWAFTYEKR